MIGKEILDKKPLTIAEALEILKTLEGEVTFEQKAAREHAEKFAKPEAREIKEKLIEAGLDPEVAVKIADLYPLPPAEAVLIVKKWKEISQEELENALKKLEG